MTVQSPAAFYPDPQRAYRLLPLRFARIPEVAEEVLLTSEAGDYLFLPQERLADLVHHRLGGDEPLFRDLQARHFIAEEGAPLPLAPLASQYRSRKSTLFDGPAMHLFVVTLRCHHRCRYCQVTPRGVGRAGSDMSEEHALQAVERLFESPARSLTVEFQGGEPLLVFPLLRFIIDAIVERNRREGRALRLVVATTLQPLTAAMLDYFARRGVYLSTSIDGPAALHNAARPGPGGDSRQRTVAALAEARAALGVERVAALVTLTRDSLRHPEALVDSYLRLGFRSIFLRPLSRYGLAARNYGRIGYGVDEFAAFYRTALDYILDRNRAGEEIEEAYAALLLGSILTPFPNGYVDLRSPAGAGLGVLVYHYDGSVYPSDEARMLAEMGDPFFRLGSVGDDYRTLFASPAMRWLLAAGTAESLPGCADCAYLPYCGADPVEGYARHGDPFGHRPGSDFCRRQRAVLGYLFHKLHEGDPATLRTFRRWAAPRPAAPVEASHGAA